VGCIWCKKVPKIYPEDRPMFKFKVSGAKIHLGDDGLEVLEKNLEGSKVEQGQHHQTNEQGSSQRSVPSKTPTKVMDDVEEAINSVVTATTLASLRVSFEILLPSLTLLEPTIPEPAPEQAGQVTESRALSDLISRIKTSWKSMPYEVIEGLCDLLGKLDLEGGGGVSELIEEVFHGLSGCVGEYKEDDFWLGWAEEIDGDRRELRREDHHEDRQDDRSSDQEGKGNNSGARTSNNNSAAPTFRSPLNSVRVWGRGEWCRSWADRPTRSWLLSVLFNALSVQFKLYL